MVVLIIGILVAVAAYTGTGLTVGAGLLNGNGTPTTAAT